MLYLSPTPVPWPREGMSASKVYFFNELDLWLQKTLYSGSQITILYFHFGSKISHVVKQVYSGFNENDSECVNFSVSDRDELNSASV